MACNLVRGCEGQFEGFAGDWSYPRALCVLVLFGLVLSSHFPE